MITYGPYEPLNSFQVDVVVKKLISLPFADLRDAVSLVGAYVGASHMRACYGFDLILFESRRDVLRAVRTAREGRLGPRWLRAQPLHRWHILGPLLAPQRPKV